MTAALDFAIGADKVEVALDHRHVVCARHGEPFRRDFPKGWEAFATTISEAALDSPALQTGLQDPRYWRATDLWWEQLGPRKHPDTVRRLLADRPACEWVPEITLLNAYRASGVGVMGLCQLCRLFGEGTPFGVREGQSYRTIAHVCWSCLLRNRMGVR